MESDTKVFGFWIYLMTDLIIFAVLFATFIVLRDSTFGGPSGKDLFHMPLVLAETLFLLISSFTCALGMISLHNKQKNGALFWFLITFLFGGAFLFIEIAEFIDFFRQNASFERSAFLSSFFALVGTHGFHISCGMLWMGVSMYEIWSRPLAKAMVSRAYRMALFWHFLDFVWIFIFTVVYGMGFL